MHRNSDAPLPPSYTVCTLNTVVLYCVSGSELTKGKSDPTTRQKHYFVQNIKNPWSRSSFQKVFVSHRTAKRFEFKKKVKDVNNNMPNITSENIKFYLPLTHIYRYICCFFPFWQLQAFASTVLPTPCTHHSPQRLQIHPWATTLYQLYCEHFCNESKKWHAIPYFSIFGDLMATSFRVVVLKEGDHAESLQSVVCTRVKAIFFVNGFLQ